MIDEEHGLVLLIDKPLGRTSFDVVKKIRAELGKSLHLKKIKVGHAGTLDPLASGLLILCAGKATKRIHEIQDLRKEYSGTITLGATTPSYDKETEPDAFFEYNHVTEALLDEAREKLTGEIDQVPPIYSAKKVKGKKAYDMARKGETPVLQPRKVRIFEFEIENISPPNIDFKVKCSKGTYIRSLAFDLGKAVNSGAHLSALRRTAIGKYRVEDAYSIERAIIEIREGSLKNTPFRLE